MNQARASLFLIALLCLPTAQSQSPKLPPPPPEMQSLTKALAGKWTTAYNFEKGGMSPEGGNGTGEENWRTAPGGYVLMEEETIHAPFGEMALIALQWWDKTTNTLRGMLCNNSGPQACNVDTYANSKLSWDGKQLVIDMHYSQNGMNMMWHEVWSNITPTSFTQTADAGEAGKPLKRVVTIVGTRVAN
jgi:hypothetical protein